MTPAWPPLLLGRDVPRWVRWRDVVLTLAAWAVLAYWMRGAVLLLYDWVSAPMFELTTQRAPDWQRIWRTLSPFLSLAALLAAWLLYWASRRRALLGQDRDSPQPAPLGLDAHAEKFGLTAATVDSMRRPQVLTVRFDNTGHIAGGQPDTPE
jgi:poly-beta-1,6-N-acetyl-D-glucosamine biosynthesis protein PgaD